MYRPLGVEKREGADSAYVRHTLLATMFDNDRGQTFVSCATGSVSSRIRAKRCRG